MKAEVKYIICNSPLLGKERNYIKELVSDPTRIVRLCFATRSYQAFDASPSVSWGAL